MGHLLSYLFIALALVGAGFMLREVFNKVGKLEDALAQSRQEREMLAQSFAMAEASEQRAQQERDTLRAALEKYGEHRQECILTRFEVGEPTPDGKYRWKYAGHWYAEMPKCQCGLTAALGGTKEEND